jgi:transcriptional regulator with XRE-family HTH domain
MRIGTVLRKWRITEERTLRETAKELGIGTTALLRVEQDKNPDGTTIAAILRWLLGKDRA